MGKFLKWILAAVGVLILLVVIVGVALPLVVDPNDYKEEISAAVFEKTGRELSIGGEIEWTVFPSVGLKLSDVKLGGHKDSSDQMMLDIGEFGATIKLVPLLSRKLEIGEVSLSDVSVRLQTSTDDQIQSESLSGMPSESRPLPTDQVGDSFVVSGVEISNASLSLKDAGQIKELKEFGSIASHIELGQPFDLEGGFSLNMPERQIAGDVKFDGRVQSAANGMRYLVEHLELSFKGNRGPESNARPLDLTVTANADIDLEKDQAALSDFVLNLYDLIVVGNLDVASILTDPEFTGRLKVSEFNPKSLMKALGLVEPVTANPDAMTRLQADMSFAGSANYADMQDLTVRFDDSIFKGNLKIDNIKRPRLAFDFEIDKLNLDDYTPDSGSEASADSGGEPEDTDLTVETFRGFTGGGDFRIGELVVGGMKATEASMTMSSDGQGVRFYPVKAQFYGGQYEGDIRVDASGSRPMLIVDQGLTAVMAEGLLKDLTGSASLLGVGDFFLTARTDLTNSNTILQSLSGDIGMSVVNGAIVGIDVTKILETVNSLLGSQEESEPEGQGGQDQKTEFAELSMTGAIEQGIMKSNDLMMLSPLMQVTGEGSFNLVEESVDYLLNPVITGGTGVESLDALSGTTIPIRLTGNLYEPDYKIDIAAALISSQQEVIDQKVNEVLGGLLGGKKEKKNKKNRKNKEEGGDSGG